MDAGYRGDRCRRDQLPCSVEIPCIPCRVKNALSLSDAGVILWSVCPGNYSRFKRLRFQPGPNIRINFPEKLVIDFLFVGQVTTVDDGGIGFKVVGNDE